MRAGRLLQTLDTSALRSATTVRLVLHAPLDGGVDPSRSAPIRASALMCECEGRNRWEMRFAQCWPSTRHLRLPPTSFVRRALKHRVLPLRFRLARRSDNRFVSRAWRSPCCELNLSRSVARYVSPETLRLGYPCRCERHPAEGRSLAYLLRMRQHSLPAVQWEKRESDVQHFARLQVFELVFVRSILSEDVPGNSHEQLPRVTCSCARTHAHAYT